MARSGGSPSSNPNANPNANPGSPPAVPAAPPPAPPANGPTGNSGFLVGESSMQTAQSQAADLQSQYTAMAGRLSGLQLAPNALGPIGLFAVPALNSSNGKSVEKANDTATAFGNVQKGLKSTAEAYSQHDQFAAQQFGKIMPDPKSDSPASPHPPSSASPDNRPSPAAANPDVIDLRNLSYHDYAKWSAKFTDIMKTDPNATWFWTGGTVDANGDYHSVMDLADFLSKNNGGSTLENKIDGANIQMPGWNDLKKGNPENFDPLSKPVWTDASAALAHNTSGDVYVVMGQSRRQDNVFDMTEFPILRHNPNVNRIFTVDWKYRNIDQIWPDPYTNPTPDSYNHPNVSAR
jgi:hypothetical protein